MNDQLSDLVCPYFVQNYINTILVPNVYDSIATYYSIQKVIFSSNSISDSIHERGNGSLSADPLPVDNNTPDWNDVN